MLSVYSGQGPDKRFHNWGQDKGSARFVISYCLGDDQHSKKCPATRPAILLEPFAGGGATLEAAKTLGVDYVAFEVETEAAKICQQRMDGFVPPKVEKNQYALSI